MKLDRTRVAELLERHASAAPRYTSYPTVLDWDPGFDPASQAACVERAAALADPYSVYVHVPFCERRCLFCGCNVAITRSHERVEAYLDALEHELRALAALGLGRRPVRELHLGGGTPTHLDGAQLERVCAALESRLAFLPGAERAVEVDPRVTDAEQLRLLARLGFRRLSLGVQDLDERVQAAIGRRQAEEDTRALVELARELGFTSISLDLMYGLPHQDRESFARTLERALTLRPDRLALFHYAHVPWIKPHQRALDAAAMPEAPERLGIFLDSVETLVERGYAFLGLDHFALEHDELARAHRAGRMHRDFMGYTARPAGDLLGLGASAIGELGGAFLQNEPEEPEYRERIAAGGGLVAVRGHALTPDDRLRRDVILGLMCRGRVDRAAIEAAHGVRFASAFAPELEALRAHEADGLIRVDAQELEVTPLGQLFLRNLASIFDRYLRSRTRDRERSYSRTH